MKTKSVLSISVLATVLSLCSCSILPSRRTSSTVDNKGPISKEMWDEAFDLNEYFGHNFAIDTHLERAEDGGFINSRTLCFDGNYLGQEENSYDDKIIYKFAQPYYEDGLTYELVYTDANWEGVKSWNKIETNVSKFFAAYNVYSFNYDIFSYKKNDNLYIATDFIQTYQGNKIKVQKCLVSFMDDKLEHVELIFTNTDGVLCNAFCRFHSYDKIKEMTFPKV